MTNFEGISRLYDPYSFWNDKEWYIQVLTEKIDLKSLFQPVCAEFHIPIANAGGWADLHLRASMLKRFAYWEERGNMPILLYCGDFDPGGVLMSDTLMEQMQDLAGAVGWNPSTVTIDRFGLNQDFIEANGLPWIDNLITSSGKSLDDPRHHDHNKPHVQKWLQEIGVRKCEANALVVNPDAGRALCLDAVTKYLDPDHPAEFESRVELARKEVRNELRRLVRVSGQG